MKKSGWIVMVLLSAGAVSAELRTWTADDGKTVEAEFVSRSMKLVRLKTENGKTLNVPLNRLSEEDRIYVELHSPPTLQVSVEPNKNTVSESALNRRGEGYTVLEFEVSVRKTSRFDYSRPLRFNLYVIGVQEVSGRYVVLQHVSRTIRFNDEVLKRSVIADQLTLAHTPERKSDESDYEGYVLTISDELGKRLVVQSNRKRFENEAGAFEGSRTGSEFSTDPLKLIE